MLKSKQSVVVDRATGTPRGGVHVRPEVWVDAHGDALFRFAMLRLDNRGAAEDVVQECFLAALSMKDGFEGRSSERTWLIGILRRKIVDRLRKEASAAKTGYVNLEFFDNHGLWKRGPKRWKGDPSAPAQREEFRQTLSDCVGKLPPDIRSTFLLREMDQMSGTEVCDVLGISSANLWQRLHRARLMLVRCLEINWVGVAEGQEEKT